MCIVVRFGVRQFIVIIPSPESDTVLTNTQATLILSSASVALNNTQWYVQLQCTMQSMFSDSHSHGILSVVCLCLWEYSRSGGGCLLECVWHRGSRSGSILSIYVTLLLSSRIWQAWLRCSSQKWSVCLLVVTLILLYCIARNFCGKNILRFGWKKPVCELTFFWGLSLVT